MDFSLTDEQRAIQETAREFARREVDPIVEEFDEQQKFPREVMRKASASSASFSPRSTAARDSAMSNT